MVNFSLHQMARRNNADLAVHKATKDVQMSQEETDRLGPPTAASLTAPPKSTCKVTA